MASMSETTEVKTPRCSRRLVRREGEPTLDQVEPTRAGQGEVVMPAGPSWMDEPLGHRWCLVDREVVQDDVDLLVSWNVEIDQLEERQDVVGGVAFAGVVEDLAGGHVHRRETGRWCRGACSHASWCRPARGQRQRRLAPIESLDLGLFVEAEHHGALGGIEVEADHVEELFLERGVVGHLERVDAPGA
jgi:hypothetical protein